MLRQESPLPAGNVLFATGDPVAAWNIGVAMIRGGFGLYIVNDLRDAVETLNELVVDIFLVDISTLDSRTAVLSDLAAAVDTASQTVFLSARGGSKTIGRRDAVDATALTMSRETPPDVLVNALRNFHAFIISIRQKFNAELLGATLSEGAARQDGGEVVVRSESRVGKIFFYDGKIAWAAATTQKTTLVDDLVRRAGLSKQDMRAAFEECKLVGRNFAETLVEWEVVERNLMRQILRDRIVSCIHAMYRWKRIQSIFVPQNRTYSSTLLFDLAELVVLLPETLMLHTNYPVRTYPPIAAEQLQ